LRSIARQSEELIESELFGHTRQLHRASDDKVGKFQQADAALSSSMKSAIFEISYASSGVLERVFGADPFEARSSSTRNNWMRRRTHIADFIEEESAASAAEIANFASLAPVKLPLMWPKSWIL